MRFPLAILLILLFFLPGVSSLFSQPAAPAPRKQIFRVAFYNMENLFDTIDDPLTRDAEFTPGAEKPWNTERYSRKIDHMAQVIEAISNDEAPAILGLCEVENRHVLEELLASPRIKADYRIIHFDSPDERGIDNAMLYLPDLFIPAESRPVRVDLSMDGEDRTRDILYVKGVAAGARKDTLHVFINHWPSRSGGQEISEPKRTLVAALLKSMTDSIFAENISANILITGDFNDEPGNFSLAESLKAFPPDNIQPGMLYNLMFEDYKEGKGTIYWKDWDMFDQIIVSGGLILNKKGLRLSSPKGVIFAPDWLMYETDQGVLRPNRTMAREYYGGYSDHLPVYVDIVIY